MSLSFCTLQLIDRLVMSYPSWVARHLPFSLDIFVERGVLSLHTGKAICRNPGKIYSDRSDVLRSMMHMTSQTNPTVLDHVHLKIQI